MTKVRLNKFLSDSGICSRREADEHILAGDVKINGHIAKLGDRINPQKDEISYEGKIIKPKTEEYVYYALYKPRGVISTRSDEAGRESVIDLVPKEPRVYPVGRLDKESEGLIILTNDGELTQKLTHPSFEHEKEYKVKVKSQNSEVKVLNQNLKLIEQKFLDGIKIDGKLMRAKSIKIESLNTSYYILDTVLTTGHNRQIRKMCAKMGLEVIKLVRVKIGNLELESLKLKPGEYKVITKTDLI